MDFTKIFQLKGLKPKNNDQTNFYECCDLTKNVYLKYIYLQVCNVLYPNSCKYDVFIGPLCFAIIINTSIHEIGFWSRGGRPEFFLGGLPSGIGGLLSITSIEGMLLHARGVASSKF